MMERWLDIPGTDGLYQASSLGRVRSSDRMLEVACRWGGTRPMPIKGRVLKPWLDANGYEALWVCLPDGKSARNVHRLVALAFHGEAGAAHVNHIDGDKRNNRPENLEWCTRSQNMVHARAIGLLKDSKPVRCWAKNRPLQTFPSIAAAARALGQSKAGIQRALQGKYKTSGGLEWALES